MNSKKITIIVGFSVLAIIAGFFAFKAWECTGQSSACTDAAKLTNENMELTQKLSEKEEELKELDASWRMNCAAEKCNKTTAELGMHVQDMNKLLYEMSLVCTDDNCIRDVDGPVGLTFMKGYLITKEQPRTFRQPGESEMATCTMFVVTEKNPLSEFYRSNVTFMSEVMENDNVALNINLESLPDAEQQRIQGSSEENPIDIFVYQGIRSGREYPTCSSLFQVLPVTR